MDDKLERILTHRQLLARQPELHGRFVTLLPQRVRLLVDIVESLSRIWGPLGALQ